MANPPELELGKKQRETRSPSRSLDWSRLFRAGSIELVLEEIRRWLGPEYRSLRLENDPAAAGSKLVLDPGASTRESRSRLTQAGLAIEAWRESRRELERSESRLTARSRELDRLQALGRRAAEAQTLAELFMTTISALQPCVEFDLALTAHRGEGALESRLYLTRPCAEAYLSELELRGRRFLGGEDEEGARAERIPLGQYEAARRSDRRFEEEDLVLLPLISRGQPAGCLIVVPSSSLDERQLRLLYSASNQLSLHLERILAVRAAEAGRFRSVVDSMPQGVLLFDDGNRVSHANRAAEEMLESIGGSVSQTLEQILEAIGGEDLLRRRRVSAIEPREIEVGVGDERVWNLTTAPLRGDPRRREGVVLVLSDVTERRRIQERLAQSEKMSSLGQMISGVAHELNNPLASILGYAQLLRLKGSEGVKPDQLDTLAHEAERCRKIVQNLLSFARRREPERKPLSLNQVVENVLALMRYQLRVDNVTVVDDLDRQLPVIHGDTHQLEQAVVNLLANARHAIGGTGGAGTVAVRTRGGAGGEAVLEIEDDGPGVPEERRSRIFDPFFTTKQDGEGTGLGLALVYGIVSDHGGTIELRSGSLGGARFVARFPVGKSTSFARFLAEDDSALPARSGRILIVDDEEPLARMIADVLATEGHDTCVVLDASQALERLAAGPFDLIISDLKMPGMNGDQLHAEVRRLRPELADAVLLTTGDTFDAGPEAILDRTGLDVLSKPFDLDDLRRKVRSRLAARLPDA